MATPSRGLKNRAYSREKEGPLRASTSREYERYLSSHEWALIARAARRQANYRCELCDRSGVLEVHHRTYVRFEHEWLEDLIVLCETCHRHVHDRLPRPLLPFLLTEPTEPESN